MATQTSVKARRLLVVANETCAGAALFAEIRNRTGAGAEVLVLAPALTPRLQFWLNDEALGRHAAEDLLARSFAACAHEGLHVQGEVGDADPLQAIDDAIRTFDPDAIVIVTHPVGKQNWLERDVVTQARARYALPVTHLVVEAEAARAVVVPPGPTRDARSSGTPASTSPCSCSRSASRSSARSAGASRSPPTGPAARAWPGSDPRSRPQGRRGADPLAPLHAPRPGGSARPLTATAISSRAHEAERGAAAMSFDWIISIGASLLMLAAVVAALLRRRR